MLMLQEVDDFVVFIVSFHDHDDQIVGINISDSLLQDL